MTVVHRQDVVLLERLGGSDADVHRAIIRTTGRVVVAKHTSWDRPHLSDRLDRAASILLRIQHPGLARLVARIDDDHGRCLLLAHEAGGSLGDLIASGRTCSPGDVAAIGARIATALAALHEAGVVHRDVHPGNVLLDANLAAVLADLDNALDETSPPLPGDHDVVGHPDHVDHRILTGGPAGPAGDLHGLATTLWAAATGLAPPRDDPDGPITLPTDADVPAALREVLGSILDGRVSDAGTAATRLGAVMKELAATSGALDTDAPVRVSAPGVHAGAPGLGSAPGPAGGPTVGVAGHTHRWGVPAPASRVGPTGTTDRRPMRLPRRVVQATVSLVAVLVLSLVATTRGGPSTPVAPPPQCDAADPPPGQQVLADLDGDGCAEVLGMADGLLFTPEGRFLVGQTGDVLVAGDWDGDGDGRWGIGLYRPATGEVFLIDDPGPGATSRPAELQASGGTPVVVPGPSGHEVRVDVP